ncbi:MAG: response regulator, partial [Cyclobacteriaceae bacterium]|nr:response regulator [Cyclobacteriaceae bacterium]
MTLLTLVVILETAIGQEWKVAQTRYRFHHLNTKHGLANEFAYSIAQDSLGFIWVEYYGGLSRYDGYNFKIIKHDPANLYSLGPDFVLMNINTDASGNLWAIGHMSLNGVKVRAKRDSRTGRLDKHFLPDDATVNPNSSVFDKDGRTLWLCGVRGGFHKYDIQQRTVKTYFVVHPKEDQRNYVNHLADRGNSLLVATAKGLWEFDKSSESFKRPALKPIDSSLLYRSEINSILDFPDRMGESIWLVSGQRLIEVDSAINILRIVNLPHGIRTKELGRDNDGVFWFSAGTGGLGIYDPRTGRYQHIVHDPADPWSLPSDDVLSVFVDRDQNVWIGTTRGLGLLRRKDLEFYNFSLGQGVGYSAILEAKGQEYLLLAKMDGVQGRDRIYRIPLIRRSIDSIQIIDSNIASGSGISPSLYLGRQHLWASISGTASAQIIGYPIDPDTGLPDGKFPTILPYDPTNRNAINTNQFGLLWENSQGTLFASLRGGLETVQSGIRYGTEGSVIHLSLPGTIRHFREGEMSFWAMKGKSLGLYNLTNSWDTIAFEKLLDVETGMTLLHKSRDSTIYVGTYNGLFAGRKINGRYAFRRLELAKGTILQVRVDDLGRLWLYGDNKLSCYDVDNGRLTTFGELDGVDHFQEHRAYETQNLNYSKEGIMCLASPDGLTFFDPSTFSFSSKAIVPVLTALEINNSPVDGQRVRGDSTYSVSADVGVLRELELDYQHNNFGVEFSSMDFAAPEKNLYRHKLEGYDTGWVEADFKNRTASYTNLPAGAYTFRVKASNHHGVWSDQERTLKVIILPPPWRTWWAYAGYSLLGAGLLVFARRSIVQRERLKSSLALAKVEQEKEHFELEKAKEVDRVKTSFFTNISHEFRTPLTLIKGPVQNMIDQFMSGQSTVDKDKVVSQLKLVQRNSDLLLKLINQLLDLAKLESGSLKVEKSVGEVHGFVRAIANGFDSHARQKGVVLSVEVPAGPANVLFDKDKVETILINLVNNAIKFTPQGGTITVKAACGNFTAEAQRRKGRLTIAVSDMGIGIPQDQQSKIFERFYQVSESHKEVGTGVGLALVKELVNLMGGAITVESELGKGSTFTVMLPVEQVTLEEAEQQTEVLEQATGNRLLTSAEASAGRPVTGEPVLTNDHRPLTTEIDPWKPQILVVEDNSDVRAFIIDSLGEEFSYLEAEHGKQGLEKATSEIPDLIISDVMMPEIDGITMAGKIKEDRNTSHIPLILLTAKSTEESKLSGLSSGADDYLTKPFNKQELLLKV